MDENRGSDKQPAILRIIDLIRRYHGDSSITPAKTRAGLEEIAAEVETLLEALNEDDALAEDEG